MTTIDTPHNTIPGLIYTVSELNSQVRHLLETCMANLWVEGEISNLRRLSSGHYYFSLKDQNAQVRCALFRGRANQLPLEPKEGMQVLLQGVVSLYEERGDYQVIVEYLEETGTGALKQAFERLKQELAHKGLFATSHKKPLPTFPRCIGVVTSPTGAAIRDILSVLKRRFASIPVVIYPTLVQGSTAAAQIVRAITLANQRQECDVLILARGGGSLEDLWPFNEVDVAHAIFASQIPIVSGVGHEVDVTIADFVADVRAPTPSAAAELVSPNKTQYVANLGQLQHRLMQVVHRQLQLYQQQIQWLEQRLPHPLIRLRQQMQQLDQLEQRLCVGISQVLKHKQAALLEWIRALDVISPLNTLKRGYALVTVEGKIIREAKTVAIGSTIEAQLAEGILVAKVVARS